MIYYFKAMGVIVADAIFFQTLAINSVINHTDQKHLLCFSFMSRLKNKNIFLKEAVRHNEEH